MRNGEQGHGGLTPTAARTLEYSIIALGVFALLMIFQPFNISLFPVGCALIVLGGLVNNLLPLAQPGVPKRSLVTVAMVVAMIFCIVLLASIVVAHLYGAFFLKPPDPNTVLGKVQLNATPWYMHSFTWTVAIIAAALAGLITLQSRRKD
jgi:hypothetical protein